MGANEDDKTFPNLTHLDLSANQFVALPALQEKFEALRVVCFAKNAITTCQGFAGHPNIQELDLSDCELAAATNMAAMPALTKLDLSRNKMPDINGFADMAELVELRLAGCPLQGLEGPWQDLAALKTLDISGAQLPKPAPFEILICHWRLATLNGVKVSDAELESARLLNVERLTKAAEEAAALAAAAEAAEG